jgi:hypothetical protein
MFEAPQSPRGIPTHTALTATSHALEFARPHWRFMEFIRCDLAVRHLPPKVAAAMPIGVLPHCSTDASAGDSIGRVRNFFMTGHVRNWIDATSSSPIAPRSVSF